MFDDGLELCQSLSKQVVPNVVATVFFECICTFEKGVLLKDAQREGRGDFSVTYIFIITVNTKEYIKFFILM